MKVFKGVWVWPVVIGAAGFSVLVFDVAISVMEVLASHLRETLGWLDAADQPNS